MYAPAELGQCNKNRGLGADRLIGIGSHDRTKHKFSGAEMG